MERKPEGKFHGSISQSIEYIHWKKQEILHAVDFVDHNNIRNFNRNLTGEDIFKLIKFEKRGDIYPEIYNKNITDIGWGITWLPRIFKDIGEAKKVTIVDPIFNNNASDFSAVIDSNVSKIEQRLHEWKNTLIPEAKERFEKHKKEIQERRNSNYSKWLTLNWSLGQKIVGIEDASQDIVLINHLLRRVPNPEMILKEAYRIMKDTARLYIIDYQIDRWNKDKYFYKAIYPNIYNILGDTSDRRGVIWQAFANFCYGLNKADLNILVQKCLFTTTEDF